MVTGQIEQKPSDARRQLDADVLVSVSSSEKAFLLAAQTVNGAIELARVIRLAGYEATIRVWSDGAYHEVCA